jgi:plastocyanin
MLRKVVSLAGISILIIAAFYVRSLSSAPEKGDKGRNEALSSATVSFGEWMTTPPLDRFPNASPAAGNHHALVPREVKIKAGGTVNFIIGGLHQVIVYDDGTKPGDVNATLTTPTTGTPAGVPLINDPNRRIYRGLDPSLQDRDRVEVVQFANPGTFLVICGVQPHFVNDNMFGFVRVLPADKDKD